jgi:hypothetical protein
MGQTGTATQHDTATGAISLVFASGGQIAETLPGGATATQYRPETPTTLLSSETLVWTELTRRGRTFEFSRGLQIRVLEEDGGWAYESDDPELMGFGLTRSDAEQSFCVDFAACWDEIACQDDGKLTQDAIELKQRLLALVKAQR